MPANIEPLIQFWAFWIPTKEHLLKLEDIFFLVPSFKNTIFDLCFVTLFKKSLLLTKNCAREFLANDNYAVHREKDCITYLDSKLSELRDDQVTSYFMNF